MISVVKTLFLFTKSRHSTVTAFFVLVIVTGLIAGCQREQAAYHWSGETMGTYYKISIVSDLPIQNESLDILKAGVTRELEAVNDAMSTYRSDSELSQWNRLPPGQCAVLSDGLNAVVKLALEVSMLSEGYFNPLVGPLVNRWGFGPGHLNRIPQPAEVDALLQAIDLANIDYDTESGQLCKVADASSEVQLDLSAIAKGYAVDKVATFLDQAGQINYLVDIGGELRVTGHNPAGAYWRLAVEKPDAGLQTVYRIIELSNAAVATSGDYRNFYQVEGRRYSHTINPHTGYPVQHDLASVTVVAGSVALADAWATAMLSAGVEHGRQWAKNHNLAVYFIQRENSAAAVDGQKKGQTYKEWYSTAFAQYLAD